MRKKGARLYLRPATAKEPASWVIRDGEQSVRTGLRAHERDEAEQRLAHYLATKHEPSRNRDRAPSEILIDDVLNIYLKDIAPQKSRPKEIGQRMLSLLDFFGGHVLAFVTGASCRDYARQRGSTSMARRELEDLRAAINHHRREGLCSELVNVVLPERSLPRERWLTRSEAARLLWAAWRSREVQKSSSTKRQTRAHVARFILLGLYTGTRAGAICGAAVRPTVGRGYVDLEAGIFYRRATGVRQTKKRQPPVRLPDRLLAHLRRWERLGIAQRSVIEFNGRPVTSVRKAFARAAADAGLTDVSPHTLRHTAVTWAMQGRADLWEASGYFGMSIEVLQSVYGHHHPDHGKGVIAALSRRADH